MDSTIFSADFGQVRSTSSRVNQQTSNKHQSGGLVWNLMDMQVGCAVVVFWLNFFYLDNDYAFADTQCGDCGQPYKKELKALHDSECVSKLVGNYDWDGKQLSAEEEKKEVEEANKQDKVVLGRPYFVISHPWYSAWCEYIENQGTRPPQIHNEDLIEEREEEEEEGGGGGGGGGGKAGKVYIKKGLVEKYDYDLLNPLEWQRLKAWYGGGPEIKRQVVRAGTKLVIDLYPVEVNVTFEEKHKPPVSLPLSSSNLMRMVRHWAATAINAAPHKCDIYVVSKNPEDGKEERRQLSKDDLKQTLEEFGATGKLDVFLASPNVDTSTSSYGYFGGYSHSYTPYKPPENEPGESPARGVVGLNNIGNTCFMNSSLQCLSAVPGFVSLFYHKDNYEPLINPVNMVGTKGNIAHAMHGILQDVYSGNFKSVVPNKFRNAISAIAPQFRGYNQHDAQELLSVVLNSLHEDLLVNQQPRVEKSAVLDLFGGMYKSTVTCDDCHHESHKYEPFLTLPLPVPEKDIRKVNVTFFPTTGSPIHIAVRANKTGNTNHLFTKMGELLQIKFEEGKFVAFQMSGHSGTCYEMGPNKIVSSFRDRDRVIAFERGAEEHTLQAVPCFSFRRGRMGRIVQFGVPFVVFVDPSQVSSSLIRKLIAQRLSVLTPETLNPNDLRIIKFGGNVEGTPSLTVHTQEVAKDFCLGICWDDREADILEHTYSSIPDHDSCKESLEDAEKTVTLTQCIEQAAAPDPLTAADAWKCPTCNEAKSAVKVMGVWDLPPVLCLHLKRFKMDFVSKEKIHTLVTFPEELDMKNFVGNKVPNNGKYKLIAVCNHIGGLSGGHYTAFAKSFSDNQWYDFNDKHVSKVENADSIVSPSAYCLFYVADIPATMQLELPEVVPLPEKKEGEEGEESKKENEDKVQEEENSVPKKNCGDQDDVQPSPAAAGDTSQPKKSKTTEESAPPASSAPVVDLSESAYICDFCSNPVPGGWNGLMKHVKDVHDQSME